VVVVVVVVVWDADDGVGDLVAEISTTVSTNLFSAFVTHLKKEKGTEDT
jgi:hypothetical protein